MCTYAVKIIMYFEKLKNITVPSLRPTSTTVNM